MPKFGTLSEPSKRPDSKAATKPVSVPLTPVVDLPSASDFGAAAAQSAPITLPLIMATILIFMEVGRPFDIVLSGYHIPAVIAGIGIIVTLFTNWAGALKSKVGIPLLFFVIVMAATSVTSIWRGGSVAYTQEFVELNFVVFLLTSSAPKSVGQVRWLLAVILAGILFSILAGSGLDVTGRLYLKDATFGNSDDIGLMGGFAIPLIILTCSRLNKVLGFVLGLAGVLGSLLIIGLSATRFAILSMAVTTVVYFFRTTGGQRLLIIGAVVLTLGASLFVLPKSTLQRFSTLSQVFSDSGEQDLSNEAIGSLYERQLLSKDALQCFLTHPIFGVGPNNFTVWRWQALGRHGQPAHDVYLQTGAEEGIVGVILYLAFILLCLSSLLRCSKPLAGWDDGQSTAFAMFLSMVYFAVSSFFINSQAHAHQFIMAGLSVALFTVRQQYQARLAQSQSAAASPEASTAPPSQPVLPAFRERPTAPAQPRYRFNRSISLSSKDRK